MKKQIFILVMAVFFFSFTSAYGQLAPRTITCLPADALHPIAGTAYTYKVDVPTPVSDKKYQWLVTQDQTFIENKVLTTTFETPGTSDFLAAAGATYNTVVNKTGVNAPTDQISLTWKSFTYDSNNPVFVIVNVINNDGTCSPNNLKVFRIEPIHAFTLDIDNRLPNNTALTTAGYGSNIDRCISGIVSATYDVTSGGVDYDFGKDSLYFVVAAANWSGAWKPSILIDGLETGENVEKVEWTSDPAVAWNAWESMTYTAGTKTAVADGLVEPNTAGATVGAAGEVIYIKVVLDHSDMTNPSFEGLVKEAVKVAVDGELYFWDTTITTPAFATTGKYDVHYANGTKDAGPPVVCNPLVEDNFDNDIATQTILPRPDVKANTPTPFLPVEP